MDAIPGNASIILTTSRATEIWDKVNHDNEVWNTLRQTEAIGSLHKAIHAVDSVLGIHTDVKEAFKDREIVLSLHPNPSGGSDFLFATRLRSSIEKLLISRLLGNKSEAGKASTVSNERIRTSDAGQTGKSLFYVFANHLLIAGSSTEVIDQALERLSAGESFSKDQRFLKLSPFTGREVDATLYLNFRHLPSLITTFSAKGFTPGFEKLKHFAQLSALDMHIRKSKVLLSGYTMANASDFLKLFREQEPVQPTALNLLPARTASFAYLCFTDFSRFIDSYNNYLAVSSGEGAHSGRLSLSEMQNLKESRILEIASVLVNIGMNTPARNSLVIVRCAEPVKLGSMLNETLPSAEQGITYSFNNREFRKVNFKKFFGPFLYNVFPDFHEVFYYQMDEYFLFSPEPSGLEQFLLSYLSGNTLVNQEGFGVLSDDVSEKMNIWLYYNPSEASAFHHFLFETETAGAFDSNLPSISRFDGLSLQFSGDNAMFYTSIILKLKGGYRKPEGPLILGGKMNDTTEVTTLPLLNDTARDPRLLWNFKPVPQNLLQAFILSDPSAGKSFLAVTGRQNQLYLLNPEGKILWERTLPELPVGELFYMKTNHAKPLILFLGQYFLHAYDLNGNMAKGYPIRLPAEVGGNVALVDISGRKDYRILYSAHNDSIYCLLTNGKPSRGWVYPRLASMPVQPAKMIQSGKNKYYIFTLRDGKVYITDLNGNAVESFSQSFANFTNSDVYLNETNKKGIILTTDRNGNLVYLNPDGPIEKTVFDNFSKDHFFVYEDIDMNGSPDFIYADGKQLIVYDRFKNVILRQQFQETITRKPFVISVPGGNNIILVTVGTMSHVYALDRQGLIFEEPLPAGESQSVSGILKEASGKSLAVRVAIRNGILEVFTINRK